MASTSLALRQQIINDYQEGKSCKSLSIDYQLNYGTVLSLIRRYKDKSEEGIAPYYKNCGRKPSANSLITKRLVRWYRHFHPTWGVEYILIKIRQKYPELALLSCRTYERYLAQEGLVTMPKSIALPIETYGETSRQAHDTWQVDAKERLTTLDGKPACYLTFTDEATGSILEANVFSLCKN